MDSDSSSGCGAILDHSESAPRPQKIKRKNFFQCCVAGCNTNSLNLQDRALLNLHSFPVLDGPRLRKWLVAVNRRELADRPRNSLIRLRVCTRHFADNLRRGKKGKLRDASAVPTLHLQLPPSPAPAPLATVAASCDDVFILPDRGTAPAPVSNRAPPRSRRPRDFSRLLALRRLLVSRNVADKGFDRSFVFFALNLYLAFPRAYRVLHNVLRLPAPGVLARVQLDVGTYVSDQLVTCLKSKLGALDPQDRECALCVDEVELDRRLFYAVEADELVGLAEIGGMVRARAAQRALVLVACGVRARWTQPLGYCFLADDDDPVETADHIRKLVESTLCHRLESRVVALVSAMGPTFTELTRALTVDKDCPYLLDRRVGNEIHFMYDLDQLILTLRDTLMAYDLRFEDEDGVMSLASWRDVRALLRKDSVRALPLLPVLARGPPSGQQEARDPRRAAALFSRSVAVLMHAQGADAAGTARLLALVSDMRVRLRAPLIDRPLTVAALDAVDRLLCRMTLVSQSSGEYIAPADEYVRCLRITLGGLRHLLSAKAMGAGSAPLLRKHAYSLGPVRRFVEESEGERGRIAPVDFRRRFRRWVMRSLLEPVREKSAGAGRVDIRAMLEWVQDREPVELDCAVRRSGVHTGDLQHRLKPGEPGEVARGLLAQMRLVHDCPAMAAALLQPAIFEELVANMDDKFKEMFTESERVMNVVGRQLVATLTPVAAFAAPCSCFPTDEFCRLYTRFRIRAALLAHNRVLRAPPYHAPRLPPHTHHWLFQ